MTSSIATKEDKSEELIKKVKSWIATEGYSLELLAADKFANQEFRVFSGAHVRDQDTNVAREVDVSASRDTHLHDTLLRVSYIVECKWSRDKPWIIFTSKHDHIASGACIAQTMASNLGEALLWCEAGNKILHETDTFATPRRPGYGGCQAFSKGNDLVYNSLQKVTSDSLNYVQSYDDGRLKQGVLPTIAVVAIPVIVVDGKLFDVSLDVSSRTVSVEPADYMRLHWQGSNTWRLRATVDIVTIGALDAFVKRRAQEAAIILEVMKNSLMMLLEAKKSRSWPAVKVTRASRGIIGLPPLLSALRQDLGLPKKDQKQKKKKKGKKRK